VSAASGDAVEQFFQRGLGLQVSRSRSCPACTRQQRSVISKAYTVKRSSVLTDLPLWYALNVDTLNLTAILSCSVDSDNIEAMGTLDD
jgi:hypothetical protein